MLVDTHCHLDFRAFDEDRPLVLERAREAGILRILNPGTDLESSRAAVALAQQYQEVYAAVGVHPTDALTWTESTLDELRDLAQHPKVAAIGEIGLDDYWDRAPMEVQHTVLRRQLELAAELGLPVVIHSRNKSPENRRATADLYQILAEWHSGIAATDPALAARPGVLHSFSEDERYARQVTSLGFWIGVTGPVTFRNAPVLQQVVTALPLERLLIETDAPFLTPQPYRGKRNEPAHVRYVAEKIAALRGVPLDEVANQTTSNAERLFHW